ncbi:MAG: Nramp family divalent metal transporter [Pirellulales bacterium]
MPNDADASTKIIPPLPPALSSRNPLEWLRLFGPGAVIASLTIGTGELIFSSRGGVIFGYPILFLFTVICVLKWTLAYSAARHMVISGAHPFQRWMAMPVVPRGSLPMLFFLLAAAFIPVWISFHASVLGDLIAGLTHTKPFLGGATIHLWGAALVLGIVALSLSGGYSALEKIQIIVVTLMLAAVMVTLIIFQPDWLDFLGSFVVPQRLEYPAWLFADSRPAMRQIAERPVWVELSLYAGVIGGAGYDYLAYTSYIRDKAWGNAAAIEREPVDSSEEASRMFNSIAADMAPRTWLRAPLIDCTLSFLVVLIFTSVFVASGKLVLGPEHQIPGDGAFLEHQAQFVTRIHPWLYPLYLVAVFLTMGGTLYGTLEIAPTILREVAVAIWPRSPRARDFAGLRRWAIWWCAAGALIVLAASFIYQIRMGEEKPPGLTTLLIPVNLFTGVFACGLICLCNPWIDRRLPSEFRMPLLLQALNAVAGVVFIVVALRGYWDFAGWIAMVILTGILAAGIVIAKLFNATASASQS